MGGFGLIGRTLGHSFSPALHGLIGDYAYGLYELAPEELETFVKTTALQGFNVTVPYKRAVLPLCARLSDRARTIGSVNTMVRLPGGGFFGDNTDYIGFRRLLGDDADALRGQKAVVLGSGGASKTVCAVLADAGLRPVVISRTGADNYTNLQKHADAALVVNATPVGTAPDCGASPVELSAFPGCRLVLDLVYNPARTALLRQAQELGVPARNGLLMLTAQAVGAAELFTGREYPGPLAAELARTLAARTRTVTLIGMPGCGKTAVGRALSALTGRELLDTDELAEREAGLPVAEIFEKYGEARFRALETEALRKAAGRPGVIVSCGGGVVTRPENRPLLRQNGPCLWLTRPLAALCTAGRPLSGSRGVEALWREREGLYRACCDRIYENDAPDAAARRIREDWEL